MKKTLTVLFISLSLCHGQTLTGLSSFVPGLGQTFNGQYLKGGLYFSSVLALMAQRDVKLQVVGLNLWFYNMYDAWSNAGGKPSHKNHLLYDYAQMFNPMNIVDPFAVGTLAVASSGRNSARESAFNEESGEDNNELIQNIIRTENWKSMLTFAAVGMGEEALFRGFLFPAISKGVGVYGGALISSLLFSFAHTGAGSGANLYRTLFGLIFCWQYHYNNYKLEKNIFTHAWYNQILIGPFSIAPPAGEKFSLKNRPLGLKITYSF